MSPERLRSGSILSSRSTGAHASGKNDADHDIRSNAGCAFVAHGWRVIEDLRATRQEVPPSFP